ncbi:MAG: ROK family protein [Thermoleophilia bacterium]|nr:ROK family protein [Thermoleophilia bacterium]
MPAPRTLGLDLGGTNIKAAVLEHGTAGPRIVHEGRLETGAPDGPAAVLERIAELGRRALAAAGPVAAAGLGAPGPLDLERGVAVFLPNLPGWEEQPLVAPLAERLGLPVALVNDARALTLAAHALGAGRDCDTLVCVAIGTGVGGGVIVGGRLATGLGGLAGELGHLTIVPDGRRCPCGNRGCLERYAAGPAIARAAGTGSAREAAAAARSGSPRALAALAQAGRALGLGLANAALVVGPDRLVVGGGVAAAGELLLDPARRELARRLHVLPVDRIELVPAELGPLGGAVGAALYACERSVPSAST